MAKSFTLFLCVLSSHSKWISPTCFVFLSCDKTPSLSHLLLLPQPLLENFCPHLLSFLVAHLFVPLYLSNWGQHPSRAASVALPWIPHCSWGNIWLCFAKWFENHSQSYCEFFLHGCTFLCLFDASSLTGGHTETMQMERGCLSLLIILVSQSKEARTPLVQI